MSPSQLKQYLSYPELIKMPEEVLCGLVRVPHCGALDPAVLPVVDPVRAFGRQQEKIVQNGVRLHGVLYRWNAAEQNTDIGKRL